MSVSVSFSGHGSSKRGTIVTSGIERCQMALIGRIYS